MLVGKSSIINFKHYPRSTKTFSCCQVQWKCRFNKLNPFITKSTVFRGNIKQLLDEVKHGIMNYEIRRLPFNIEEAIAIL